MRRLFQCGLTPLLAAVVLTSLTVVNSDSLQAQTTPSNGGVSGANGVVIDAEGVLRLQQFSDPGGVLAKKRLAEARARLNPDVAQSSDLRKVSLNRLEAAVRKQLAGNKPPTEEMQYLAGLTRVRYVFYYPETQDIVLAGPSEGWSPDVSDRMVGMDTGRPVLQLQDLIVALRAYPPQTKKPITINVSIDPTAEGLQRMQQFLSSIGSTATPADTEVIVNGLRTNLGMQNIRIGGVKPTTHLAQVLLECDYRMKLIGIGVEKPPVKMVSYVDRATGTSRNALERWYFTPDYKSARVAADNLGLELVGDTVKLVSENQLVGADGSRASTGKANKASELFTTAFTAKYGEIAARLPVFAEMRNMVDLAIAAAFINQQDFYGKAGWAAETFNDEGALSVETYNTPQQVETVCTAIWKGNRLFTPVGGGVTIHADKALSSQNRLADEDGKISTLRESIDLKDVPGNRWWWD